MEGSLDLQMLLSIPRCDSEGKKKKERNTKINFPTWHILKGTDNWLYNYISKSLEDYITLKGELYKTWIFLFFLKLKTFLRI